MNDLAPPIERPRPSVEPVAMERHVVPFANGDGVIVTKTSDSMFGPDGLGFGGTPWTKLVSYLARTGISEQTGSRPNETLVKGCAVGWGQGAYSSHVFQGEAGADVVALERLIERLRHLAVELEGAPDRITARVAAAYVNTQPAQPFSTHTGMREARTLRDSLSNRFRAHIQWQSLVTLCGYVDQDGRLVLTRSLLKRFFTGEGRFFADFADRRRKLRSGELAPGTPVGFLEFVDPGIDRVATDQHYQRNKSGLRLVLVIAYHMLVRTGT